ncbi:MAG: hypothetical protein RSB05_08475 [Clostridiales bacterium]
MDDDGDGDGHDRLLNNNLKYKAYPRSFWSGGCAFLRFRKLLR